MRRTAPPSAAAGSRILTRPPPAPSDLPAPLTRPEWAAEAAGEPLARVGAAAAFRRACLRDAAGTVVTPQVMHNRYADWCRAEGFEPLLLIPFGQDLVDAGVRRVKTRLAGRDVATWRDVALLPFEAEEEFAAEEEPAVVHENPTVAEPAAQAAPAVIEEQLHAPVNTAPADLPVETFAIEQAEAAVATELAPDAPLTDAVDAMLAQVEEPAADDAATDPVAARRERLAAFIARACDVGDDRLRTPVTAFFAAYAGHPWTPRHNAALLELTDDMAALGHPKFKLRTMFFRGVALRDAPALAAPVGGRPKRAAAPAAALGPEAYITWLRDEVARREAEKAERVARITELTEQLGEADLALSNYRAALSSAERLAA